MSIVGIIANPSAGRDIRRLVAHASVFDNNEKVNIVRRVLLALDATGVQRVLFMPDAFGIGRKALDNLHLKLTAETVAMAPRFEERDSTEAAARMAAAGACSLITLGGDGTNRAVAKACGAIPLTPISTGTNNVFPVMVEGTVAGLAAGLVATGAVPWTIATRPTKRLELWRNDQLEEIALVDAVVYRERFIGARAIWHADEIQEVVLAHADPFSIGLSAIGGYLERTPLGENEGLFIEVGDGGATVLAPIAPGLIQPIPVKSHRRLQSGDSITIDRTPTVIALDGERKFTLHQGERVEIRLSQAGPLVVDISRTLQYAVQNGWFVRSSQAAPTANRA